MSLCSDPHSIGICYLPCPLRRTNCRPPDNYLWVACSLTSSPTNWHIWQDPTRFRRLPCRVAAPWEVIRGRISPRRVLPLRLGGQAAARPGGVIHRILPGDIYDRRVFMPRPSSPTERGRHGRHTAAGSRAEGLILCNRDIILIDVICAEGNRMGGLFICWNV